MKYRIFAFAVLVLMAPLVVRAAETVQHRYPLPGHGSFELAVPTAWVGTLRQPKNGIPPSITFEPKSGAAFKILVTPIYPVLFKLEPPDAETLREHVQAMAVRVAGGTTKKAPPLHELKGVSGVGYYFSGVQHKPGPKGYRYVTAGVLRVDTLVVDFAAMSNEDQPKIVKQALAMLRGARHIAPARSKPSSGGTH